MQTEISRLMMEIAVSRSIRQIQSGDSVRALRQLVDFTRRYAASTFAVTMLDFVSDMLRIPNHPYIRLFQLFINQSDWKYLNGFGVTEGCETLTGSGDRQRRLAGEKWYRVIRLSGSAQTAEAEMRQAFENGVHTFLLSCESAPDAGLIGELCGRYPTAACTLVIRDDDVTDELLDRLRDVTTLAIAAVRTSGSFSSREKLENHRRVCFLCRKVSEEEAKQAVRENRLPGEDGLLMCYLPDEGMDPAVLNAFDTLVVHTRMHPSRPFMPLIFPQDLQRVEDMITGEKGILTKGIRAIDRILKK